MRHQNNAEYHKNPAMSSPIRQNPANRSREHARYERYRRDGAI